MSPDKKAYTFFYGSSKEGEGLRHTISTLGSGAVPTWASSLLTLQPAPVSVSDKPSPGPEEVPPSPTHQAGRGDTVSNSRAVQEHLTYHNP